MSLANLLNYEEVYKKLLGKIETRPNKRRIVLLVDIWDLTSYYSKLYNIEFENSTERRDCVYEIMNILIDLGYITKSEGSTLWTLRI